MSQQTTTLLAVAAGAAAVYFYTQGAGTKKGKKGPDGIKGPVKVTVPKVNTDNPSGHTDQQGSTSYGHTGLTAADFLKVNAADPFIDVYKSLQTTGASVGASGTGFKKPSTPNEAAAEFLRIKDDRVKYAFKNKHPEWWGAIEATFASQTSANQWDNYWSVNGGYTASYNDATGVGSVFDPATSKYMDIS